MKLTAGLMVLTRLGPRSLLPCTLTCYFQHRVAYVPSRDCSDSVPPDLSFEPNLDYTVVGFGCEQQLLVLFLP